MRVPGRQELPFRVLAAQVLEEPARSEDRCLLVHLQAFTTILRPLFCPGSLDLFPSIPTHGSGSRLFALATKLKGMKPSSPVVRDCAFHHSPLLRNSGDQRGRLSIGNLETLPQESQLCHATPPSSPALWRFPLCLKGIHCKTGAKGGMQGRLFPLPHILPRGKDEWCGGGTHCSRIRSCSPFSKPRSPS